MGTLKHEAIKIHNTRYGRIAVFSHDTGALARALPLYGEWAGNEINFLSQFIRPGATVLDIGAYVGTHSLAFSKLVGSAGRVVAFEPQEETFRLLQENISENNADNVELENAAVGASSGTIAINAVDIESEASFGSLSINGDLREARAIGDDGRVRVRTLAIDELGLKTCDVVKIDVEGAEDLVIDGMADTLRRCRPIVYAECNSVDAGLATWKKLRDGGYVIRLHVVDAFNSDNFCGAGENIFGNAREAALVGIPGEATALLEAVSVKSCELFLELQTADDLALGLLNKPQYPEEILRQGRAAISGGDKWLDEVSAFSRLTGFSSDWISLEETRAEIDRVRQVAGERAFEIARLEELLVNHLQELESLRGTQAELDQVRQVAGERAEEIERLVAQIRGHLQELEMLRSSSEAALLEANFVRKGIRAAQGEALLLRGENERLEAQLNAIRGSFAWRVAELVRSFRRRLRRLNRHGI